MKPTYEREKLIITEFDAEDVITTSGVVDPTSPERNLETENAYSSFSAFKGPGSWF